MIQIQLSNITLVLGAALIISHDRYFLDRTVERLLAIEDKGLKEYQGGYSDYLEKAV